MVLHASAFGIFLVIDVLFCISWIIYVLFPTDLAFEIYTVVCLIMLFGSFVSQLLLCAIFWDLGKPVEEDDNKSEHSLVSLKVLDFDDEAEL